MKFGDLFNKMVILTGANGFLGSQIKQVFEQYFTVGRTKADIICDLARDIPILPTTGLVIHAAGKAHSIPKTESEKQAFFDVNVKGTQNLLKGLEQAPSLPKSFVFISSVSVYGIDKGNGISETNSLRSKIPYGLSKIKAEEIVQEWCYKNNVICTILRLPLLVGPNAPGNLGSMIKGIQKGYYFNIAGGKAKKSMVLASDVAEFIPKVANIGGVYNLTDGYHPSFAELAQVIATQLGKNSPPNMSYAMAKSISKFGDLMPSFPINSLKLKKITSDLTYDDTKARKELGWNPRRVLEHFKI